MTVHFDDSILTRRLAQGTGEILKGVRNVGLLRGRNLGEAGDDLAQSWIARVLEQDRPDDGFLSEEAADWAVHIALVENGLPLPAAVGLPDLGVVFHSDDVKAVLGPLSRNIVVSHNRAPAVAHHIADKFGFETTKMGSAGAKAMHVLLGDADAYVHAGGQYEWDSAAPVGVCTAAGLHCSRLDGSPLTYNNKDTYLPDILICRPELADDMLEAAAGFLEENGSY